MEFVYCLCRILYHPKWHLCQNVHVMVVHYIMLEVLLNFAISFRLSSLPYNCFHFVTRTSIRHNYYRRFQSLLSSTIYNTMHQKILEFGGNE